MTEELIKLATSEAQNVYYHDGGIASKMLEARPLSASDAARLILELLESSPEYGDESSSCFYDRLEHMEYCRQVIHAGISAMRKSTQTCSFSELLRLHLGSKTHCRRRTLDEIKQICTRLMLACPDLALRPVRQIDMLDCQQMIEHSFASPSMQKKAHVILHALFNFALRRAWCDINPLALMERVRVEEIMIDALEMNEIKILLKTCIMPDHRVCAPALGLMLWAGIRPYEVERLTWSDIDLRERAIRIAPQHSKTGGARHVTIYPVLYRWLKHLRPLSTPHMKVVPASWIRRWRCLRRAAGFAEWRADVLRHTFASYHLKHFRDLKLLQLEMGHASSNLLRTRYLSMNKVTRLAARKFWDVDVAK